MAKGLAFAWAGRAGIQFTLFAAGTATHFILSTMLPKPSGFILGGKLTMQPLRDSQERNNSGYFALTVLSRY
jgi:hypothetical protein